MTQAADLPLFATAALAAVALSLTAFGARRRRYAGWLWWVAALWLTTLGLASATLVPAPWGAALAAPLLQQWPLVALIGLRRFHARHAWPGHAGVDAGLLVCATVAALGASLRLGVDGAGLLAVCGLAVHLYAAMVLFIAADGSDATPLQALGATMALVAFAPALTALAWAPAVGGALHAGVAAAALTAQVSAAASALGAIVLAFVALTLVCERTERQLRDSRRRLRHLANLDPLTQVPNRRRFMDLSLQALRQDPSGSAVLLLFDVDHFKLINDHLGHAAGDRALCLVAACVVEHLRAADVAGRHGGDEFVLLLRRAGTDEAMRVAGRIVDAVQRRAEPSQLPPLSLSFGLVQVAEGENIDTALRRADQALYEAKRQGRSRAVAALGNEDRPVFSASQRLGLQPC